VPRGSLAEVAEKSGIRNVEGLVERLNEFLAKWEVKKREPRKWRHRGESGD